MINATIRLAGKLLLAAITFALGLIAAQSYLSYCTPLATISLPQVAAPTDSIDYEVHRLFLMLNPIREKRRKDNAIIEIKISYHTHNDDLVRNELLGLANLSPAKRLQVINAINNELHNYQNAKVPYLNPIADVLTDLNAVESIDTMVQFQYQDKHEMYFICSFDKDMFVFSWYYPFEETLAKIGEPAVPALADALFKTNNQEQKINIICILSSINSAKARAVLEQALATETDSNCLVQIRSALANNY